MGFHLERLNLDANGVEEFLDRFIELDKQYQGKSMLISDFLLQDFHKMGTHHIIKNSEELDKITSHFVDTATPDIANDIDRIERAEISAFLDCFQIKGKQHFKQNPHSFFTNTDLTFSDDTECFNDLENGFQVLAA